PTKENRMTALATLAGLQRLTIQQLRLRYAELFGEATSVNNRTWLVRRLAWRLQSLAEGTCPSAPVGGRPSWPRTVPGMGKRGSDRPAGATGCEHAGPIAAGLARGTLVRR